MTVSDRMVTPGGKRRSRRGRCRQRGCGARRADARKNAGKRGADATDAGNAGNARCAGYASRRRDARYARIGDPMDFVKCEIFRNEVRGGGAIVSISFMIRSRNGAYLCGRDTFPNAVEPRVVDGSERERRLARREVSEKGLPGDGAVLHEGAPPRIA